MCFSRLRASASINGDRVEEVLLRFAEGLVAVAAFGVEVQTRLQFGERFSLVSEVL